MGKRFVPAPCKEGRNGLFGLLQGTEAGGADSWIGNIQIDPTKGKRALSPPMDPKRTADMTQLLAQTAPGAPTTTTTSSSSSSSTTAQNTGQLAVDLCTAVLVVHL
jgi:hypothetical protein